MKSLQVCVIGPAKSGKSVIVSKLQQKKEIETEDYNVYSLKVGDSLVYLGDAPFDMYKIKPTLALMAEADACLLCVPADQGIQRLGEIVLLINYMKLTKGVIAITKTDTAPDQVDSLKAILPKVLAETSFKDFEIIGTSSMTDEGFTEIRTALLQLESKSRDANSPFKMPIETPQEVKSGLTKVYGVIDKGSIKKYDKTILMPWGKEFIAQEISREGEIVDSAKAGERIYILYKGLNQWDVQTGDIVAAEGVLNKSKKLKIELEISKFFKDDIRNDSEIQVNVGMQTHSATIISLSKDGSSVDKATTGEKVVIETESKLPFAFEKDQTAIIINPEAHFRSIKVVGSGKIIEGLS